MPLPLARRLLSIAALLCTLGTALAQQSTISQSFELLPQATQRLELPKAELHALALTWAEGEAPNEVRYRTSTDHGHLGNWQDWPLEHEQGLPASALLTLPGQTSSVEVSSTGSFALNLLAQHYQRLSGNEALSTTGSSVPARSSRCVCGVPEIRSRNAWCPNDDCDTGYTPTPVEPEHLIVHHSGGDVTGLDYALVVRAIYDYHTTINGWDDIGYNLVVAPDGTVFQGRGTDRLGAHFCGTNPGTLGICVLGDYRQTPVPAVAIDALAQIASLVSCEFGISPEQLAFHAPSGKTLHGLAGHRDGCATECPGDQLYQFLPALREAAQLQSQGECSLATAPIALAAVEQTGLAVEVSWESYKAAERIVIERAAGNDDFNVVADVQGAQTTFLDTVAALGDVRYRIRALVDARLTDYSKEVGLMVSSTNTPVLAEQDRLRLWPNPTRDVLRVEGLNVRAAQAYIVDRTGRTILRLPFTEPAAEYLIPPGALTSGHYFLLLKSDKRWHSLPFEYLR